MLSGTNRAAPTNPYKPTGVPAGAGGVLRLLQAGGQDEGGAGRGWLVSLAFLSQKRFPAIYESVKCCVGCHTHSIVLSGGNRKKAMRT